MKKVFLLCFLGLLAVNLHAKDIAEDEDLYIMGYVRAVLQSEFDIDTPVEVQRGRVYLPESLKQNPQYEAMKERIESVSGVDKVKFVPQEQMDTMNNTWLMPSDPLFRPLIADPKWSRFSAGYHYYTKDINYKNAFDGVFGKNLSLLRLATMDDTLAEIGLQASVFATFDLSSDSFDLMNADYFVGVPVTIKHNDFSVIFRYYHQSSHLGDEYIKREPSVQRINLSYETLDFIASYDVNNFVRVYGGAGFVVRRNPSDFGRWHLQWGVELDVSPDSLFIPITMIAIDMKSYEEADFKPYVSAKIGITMSSKGLLTLDFYSGPSPHGQFYPDRVVWVGTSLSFYI